MPSIALVRHAQGSFGADDYDVLSERGHEQVEALVEDLARRGTRVDRVLSGALLRQRDTAAPIAAAAGCDVEVDARWDEYSTEDLLTHHSATAAREDRRGGEAVPALTSRAFQNVLEEALLEWVAAADGGPANEPWPVFDARVQTALHDLAADLGKGETAVVCTSGGVLAAVCLALLGVPAPAFVQFNRVTINAGLTRVVTGEAGMTLVSFNEHGHLERGGASLVTYR